MLKNIAKSTTKNPVLIIDNDLDETVLHPEKLKEVREALTKNPIPADIYLQRFSKAEQEQGFWVNGVVRQADADKNIFVIVATVNNTELQYKVHTLSKNLHSIVKNHWCKSIKAHIQPTINKEQLFEYTLINLA
jgi:hypothetical protein